MPIAAGQVSQPGRATLGVSTRTAATSSGQGKGVTIVTATARGPADTAGLRSGDVITEVEGCPIRSEAQLAALLAALTPGHAALSDLHPVRPNPYRDGDPGRLVELTR